MAQKQYARCRGDLGFHNADAQHDNKDTDDAEQRLAFYDLINPDILNQPLAAYLHGDTAGADCAVSDQGVVLPYGQTSDSFAALAQQDRPSDEEYSRRAQSMSADQRQVLHSLHQHIAAGSLAAPLRWFITGGAGVGKSFVIDMIKETILRPVPASVTRTPVQLTAPTGAQPLCSLI